MAFTTNILAAMTRRPLLNLSRSVLGQTRLMSIKAKKRFYKNVSVLSAGAGGGYELTLDSKKLKTPNGFVFSVDSEPLALAVAHEWKTQQEYIMLSQMHLTGLCNICIDNPTQTTKYALVDSALNFLDTDTILYFSHEPEGLIQRQQAEWQPIIDWFCQRYEITIEPSTTLLVPNFKSSAREAVRRQLLSHSMDVIQGFSFGVDAVKSLILMSAVMEKRLKVQEAVDLSRLELIFQTDHWGNVEWAHDLELHDTAARVGAAAVFIQCQTSQYLTRRKND